MRISGEGILAKALIIIFALISLVQFLNTGPTRSGIPEEMPQATLVTYDSWQAQQAEPSTATPKVVVGGECPQEHCLYIFTIPTCPACLKLRPTMSALTKEAADNGVEAKIVIGLGRPESIMAYSKLVDGPLVVDPTGELFTLAGVSYYPQYYLTDREGTIVKNGMIPQRLSHIIK